MRVSPSSKKPSSGQNAVRFVVFSAFLLLLAILLGTGIGDRVRRVTEGQLERVDHWPTPVPEGESNLSSADLGWKHLQVVAVATDPAFPDPRVTPTPIPTPTPTPVPKASPVAPVAPRARPRATPPQIPIWRLPPSPTPASTQTDSPLSE